MSRLHETPLTKELDTQKMEKKQPYLIVIQRLPKTCVNFQSQTRNITNHLNKDGIAKTIL